jgi:CHAT domain-containing protein
VGRHFKRLLALAALFGAIAVLPRAACAATHEQIVEACRESAGRPVVLACMKAKKGDLEFCKASAVPPVRACINREEQKQAAGKAAPSAPTKGPAEASAEAPSVPIAFVAPPRTIADITAILDQEKPNRAVIAKANANADALPPEDLSPSKLAQFYFDRARARSQLMRNRESLADVQKALEVALAGNADPLQIVRIRQALALQHQALGEPKQGMAVFQKTVDDGLSGAGSKGAVISASRSIAQMLVSMGDLGQADARARRVVALVQEARGSPHPAWRAAYEKYGNSWEADADATRALIFEAHGQYREAEAAYGRSESFRRASVKDIPKMDFPPQVSLILMSADIDLLALSRVKAKQGRLAQAEADARRALLNTLKIVGKYHYSTPKFILGLADILVEQGRYPEAEKLMRSALEAQRTVGIGDDSPVTVGALAQLGGVLTLQYKDDQASEVYAQLENATAKWETQRREVYLLNNSRIAALYAAGRIPEGIEAAQALVKRQVARTGENHFDTASARGTLAIGYARAGRAADALKEFKAAIPIMLAAARENADDDNTTTIVARSQRLQIIAEAYIGLLARAPDRGSDTAAQSFSLADAIRGRSVQQALTASSARMTAKDPALADLVRNEQDLGKQIGAQLGTLNNVLTLPSSERDENAVRGLNATIEKLRADRAQARQDINRRFPAYADLVDPKPPSVEQIKQALRPGEALLSFYFGQGASFVWAVPKDGTVVFAEIPATALDIEGKVRKLREALEPQALMVSDIPPFDLALAHELYSLLLKPVEAGWKPAKSLVVVTNGALGLMPLSLLPTTPVQVVAGSGPLFAEYRDVAWLARTHAVTMVPSAAALRTLRALPAGRPSRDSLVAFGDPYFSEKQAADAQATMEIASTDPVTTRGVPLRRRSSPQTRGVDSADLAQLPRLPDTAEELRSIALALEADPAKTLHLGKAANEKIVKELDLSGFKIVAFATHGLVAGDLDGLSQPALALSAPQVADVDGDGLLTMEEVLTLKLDADWVVLSACNTGAAASAGAEAASGLGRAFFYAGTRALLVTNWSVHSLSARELVTDLFRRQAADAKLPRADALRQAMTALLEKGFTNDKGETVFTYAHPLFWAPYTIIGDGG